MSEGPYFISYEQFSLPYFKYGNGLELLFAFHGFGRSGEDFKIFEKALGSEYTIIAFDFFYHGINSGDLVIGDFTAAHLSNLLEKMMWEEKKVRCSVIGYSLGARLILGCIHRLPHRIQNIFLLAPDGFTPDLIPRFIGGTMIGRLIGRLLVNHPGMIKNFIKFSEKLNFINNKKAKFFLSETDSKEKVSRVFNTWVLLKNFHLHLHLAQHYIRTKNIRLELFFGKNDKIISPDVVKAFIKKLDGKGKIHLLDCGHSILKEYAEISRIILKHD